MATDPSANIFLQPYHINPLGYDLYQDFEQCSGSSSTFTALTSLLASTGSGLLTTWPSYLQSVDNPASVNHYFQSQLPPTQPTVTRRPEYNALLMNENLQERQERRRVQNRCAQRAHRERKQEYFMALQKELDDLTESYRKLQKTYEARTSEVESLVQKVWDLMVKLERLHDQQRVMSPYQSSEMMSCFEYSQLGT